MEAYRKQLQNLDRFVCASFVCKVSNSTSLCMDDLRDTAMCTSDINDDSLLRKKGISFIKERTKALNLLLYLFRCLNICLSISLNSGTDIPKICF